MQSKIQKLIEEIGVKNKLIGEFEQVVRDKEEEIVHVDKIIESLEVELEEALALKCRI